MRALITRPEDDAAPLAQALADRGIEVDVEPLLAIRPIAEAAIDLDGVQALLFTSANGVRAFAALSERRDLGVLTVGDGSAAAAREAGFAHVESAAGDVNDLIRLVKERLDPRSGALFHAAGSVVAGDLAGQLGEAGYEFRRAVLYEAKPADALSEATLAALADGAFDLVLFFSPRTGATFVELVGKAGDPRVAQGCASAAALCLSQAVAGAVDQLPWRTVRSAERPDFHAMLRLVDETQAAAALPVEPMPMEGGRPDERAERPEPLSPPPLSPIAQAPGSNLGSLVAAAVIAAVIAVAAVASAPLWQPWLGFAPEPETGADPELVARIEALEQRGAELDQRLAAVDGTVDQLDARNSGAAADMSHLAGRIDELERRAALLQQDVDAALAEPLPGAPAESAIPDDLAALPAQVEELQRRLDEVAAASATAPEAAPEVTQALDGLRRQVKALQTTASGFEAWIDTVDSRLAAAEALEPRVAALEQASVAADERATGNAALALAINQLQSALATARPYGNELAALDGVAASDDEIAAEVEQAKAALAERAESGMPTLVELRAAFPEVAREVVAASRAEQAAAAVAGEADAEPGWLDQAMLKLSDLVSVRPVGEDVAGGEAAARVARAEAVLNRGDLAGAVAELDGLQGRAREAAESWLADAQARLEAEAALAALQAASVARLSPAGNGG